MLLGLGATIIAGGLAKGLLGYGLMGLGIDQAACGALDCSIKSDENIDCCMCVHSLLFLYICAIDDQSEFQNICLGSDASSSVSIVSRIGKKFKED